MLKNFLPGVRVIYKAKIVKTRSVKFLASRSVAVDYLPTTTLPSG